MNTRKLIVCVALAALSSGVALDSAMARRLIRNNEAAKAAAVTATPEETAAREDAHQDNQQSRQDRWDNASPNAKATTYNVAKSKHQQKLTRQSDAASALSKRR